MIKTVKIDDREYKIDVNPPKPRLFATITRVTARNVSGPLSEILRDVIGVSNAAKDEIALEEGEENKVVWKLGRKFSTSRKWQMLCDYHDYYMRMK